jgi:predicted aldo/keto reductase-like oxidoreductase
MEPLLGGRLVNPPQPVQAIWDSAIAMRSPTDWALQWLWAQPEVSVVLSGMSTLQQVEENVAYAVGSRINSLTTAELALVDQARLMYSGLCPIPCTKCGYCMPCPNGVDIPRNFEAYNSGVIYQSPDWARTEYKNWIPKEVSASACLQCLECDDKCPQHIQVSQWMPVVQQVLGEDQPYVTSIKQSMDK